MDILSSIWHVFCHLSLGFFFVFVLLNESAYILLINARLSTLFRSYKDSKKYNAKFLSTPRNVVYYVWKVFLNKYQFMCKNMFLCGLHQTKKGMKRRKSSNMSDRALLLQWGALRRFFLYIMYKGLLLNVNVNIAWEF